MGSNILQGKDIMNISMPVTIFEKKSFLQRMGRGFGNSINLLERAASTSDVTE